MSQIGKIKESRVRIYYVINWVTMLDTTFKPTHGVFGIYRVIDQSEASNERWILVDGCFDKKKDMPFIDLNHQLKEMNNSR